ncbi:MAG: SUMF1/EgtB/PvdO family nonheme iron enzyme [Gammaproteobacteria bacterium]|nr:SUMF1/EgtB/PvdO family nonheme iron enzyme [Gammaproteobacteria bacterium]
MPETRQTEPIFLSYSRTDHAAAIGLRHALEQAGLQVFRDVDSIRVGDNWMESLQEALQNCSSFILLIGRDGVRRWVGAEVQVALSRNLSAHDDSQRLPLFPILLPDGDPQSLPPFLGLFQLQSWRPEEDLPQSLIDAIRSRKELLDRGSYFEGCPYLGLSAFQQIDAELFFGRRRETLETLKTLGIQQNAHPEQIDSAGSTFYRWLQIEGNSGAGKSSLVNAGMLPLIQQGALWSSTGYENWRILGPLLPGERPLQRLAEVLEQAFQPDPEQRDSLQRLKRLEQDERALGFMLHDQKDGDTAFLLVVDQFEELFTFSDAEEKRRFDVELAYALQDKACPLFLISTVRIDFLEGFEQLPQLSELYNRHCKRYLLKTISRDGLREVIEQPARLADLDVSEITTAILGDTEHEIGALPLVENALRVLWEQRQGNRLSGSIYRDKGGVVGLLEEQADSLLDRLDQQLSGGRNAALELLLALTRINDEGRHTRRRLPLQEAKMIAGGKRSDPERGQRVIDYLTGRSSPDGSNPKGNGSLRLLTTVGETEQDQSIDLIHETLIRARGKDPVSGKLIGYWQTLYGYIEKHRDRGFYRDQLSRRAQAWDSTKGLARWRGLAGWRELKHYRRLRPAKDSVEARFRLRSRRLAWFKTGLAAALLALVAESYLWTLSNAMPPNYMWMQQRFRLMQLGWQPEPLPKLKDIHPSNGEFQMGELDTGFVEVVKSQPEFIKNFGIPSTTARIETPFAIGRYEVSYEEYDYYVWQQQGTEDPPEYPNSAPGDGGRGPRAVVNVSWHEANGYLQWLSAKTGHAYRLPTEAEWEYAARAGTDSPYWWGEEAGQGRANCEGCGSAWDNKYVAPVGSFEPNPWGLHDTAGNVWEWTCSAFKETFDGSEGRCADPTDTGRRVLRGGSWNDSPEWLRSSARDRSIPDDRTNDLGFRVLRGARTD